MNMDLIILVIIFYIFKNNSCKYCYAENRNQKLLLFLLFINEIDQCLNNKYSYVNLINNKNRYYMNYPNHASDNSNDITNANKINTKNNYSDTLINNNKDTTKNDNKDRLISSYKDVTKNTDKDHIINNNKDTTINNNEDDMINGDKDDAISKNNKSSIDVNKNNIINNNDDNIIVNNNKNSSIKNAKDCIINSNKETTINNNKDSLININENITKNADKDNVVKNNKDTTINNNNDNIINNDNNPPTDNNKDSIINTNKAINDIDTIINSDKETSNNTNTDMTIESNKENSTSNNKISNTTNLENKFIKPATKIHNESSIYNNPCKKNNTISISNTFKQLPLAKTITALSEFAKHFILKAPAPLTDVKVKVPVLVGSTNITELFHGKVTFCNPIISILKVTNEIFITSKSILPTLHTNANNAVLHYEGFLKTQLEYLEDVIIEKYQIKCDSKHYIMLIPFSGSKELNFTDEIINSPNIILKDISLDINKSTFSIDTCLEEPIKGNKYINLYKTCNLTVKVECAISLYREKLVDL